MYAIDVYSPNGSLRRVLTPVDAIDAVAWQRRGDGDCGEAMIRGKGLDLRPRDIVAIRTANAGVQYAGWVVESHDPRDTGLVETRLVGGASRLGETINTVPWMAGGDVAAMAGQLPVTLPLPPMVNGIVYDLLGLQAGPREPRLETLADTLDGLAALAPGFTVPTGGSYKYAGVTYGPGSVIPPVRWGTLPTVTSGKLVVRGFFRRAVGEWVWDESSTAAPIVVEWSPLVSEDVVDRVVVVLFDRVTQGATWRAIHTDTAVTPPPGSRGVYMDDAQTPVPVAHRYALPGSNLAAWARVDQPPSESLRAVPLTASGTANFSDLGRAFDGDLTTYASSTAAGRLWINRQGPLDARGIRIRYSSFVPLRLSVNLQRQESATATASAIAELELPATNGEQADATLLCPPSLRTTAPSRVLVSLDGSATAAGDVRVYDFVGLAPDVGVLDRIAQSAVRLPPAAAATVTLLGRIVAPRPNVTVTLASGGILAAQAESWEYSITREEGFGTRVRLAHDLPAEQARAQALLAQRIDGRVRGGLRRLT